MTVSSGGFSSNHPQVARMAALRRPTLAATSLVLGLRLSAQSRDPALRGVRTRGSGQGSATRQISDGAPMGESQIDAVAVTQSAPSSGGFVLVVFPEASAKGAVLRESSARAAGKGEHDKSDADNISHCRKSP